MTLAVLREAHQLSLAEQRQQRLEEERKKKEARLALEREVARSTQFVESSSGSLASADTAIDGEDISSTLGIAVGASVSASVSAPTSIAARFEKAKLEQREKEQQRVNLIKKEKGTDGTALRRRSSVKEAESLWQQAVQTSAAHEKERAEVYKVVTLKRPILDAVKQKSIL